MESKIIFSKFSTERAAFLQIRTDIVKTAEGKKYVLKTPLTKEAKPHIDNLFVIREKLNDLYCDKNVLINRCERINEGIRFDYIEGITFEEKLDSYLLNQDYNNIFEMIKDYKEKFLINSNRVLFQMSEAFQHVFGEVSFHRELDSLATSSNIDLIFSNVIINDQWNVIDYEWTFDFLIPSNFILYRAICNYIYSSEKRAELLQFDLFHKFGIEDDELEQYKNMDTSFHQYVLKGYTPLNVMYPSFNRLNYHIKEFASDYVPGRVQVFYDSGNGFTEDNSSFINCKKTEEEFILNISLEPNVKMVRIDPTDKHCILKLSELCLDEEDVAQEGKDIKFWINGDLIGENLYLFNTDDPQIVIPEAQNVKQIKMKFRITNINMGLAQHLSDCIREKSDRIIEVEKSIIAYEKEKNELIQKSVEEKETLLKDYTNEITTIISKYKDEITAIIDDYANDKAVLLKKYDDDCATITQKYEDEVEKNRLLVSSMSWKITKPFRTIKDLLIKK